MMNTHISNREINQKEKLYQQIIDTFPQKSPPLVNEITYDDDECCNRVKTEFNSLKWWSANCDFINRNYDVLSLFTSTAFHYYLPAFLICSLKRFEPDNRILEYTIYSLSPTKTSQDDPWLKERLRLFTPEQINTIRNFLEYILYDESMYAFHKDAERGIRKFWYER